MFGLLNLAMADGYIASWEAKYRYKFWRPITAIRLGDTDDNPLTQADPSWTPLQPTYPMPDHDSGHAVQGGVAAEILKQVFGTDQIPFTACSTTVGAGLTWGSDTGAPPVCRASRRRRTRTPCRASTSAFISGVRSKKASGTAAIADYAVHQVMEETGGVARCGGTSAGRFEPVRTRRLPLSRGHNGSFPDRSRRFSVARGALGCSLRLLTNCANSAPALTFRESSGASTAIVRHAPVEWHRSRWFESCRRQRDGNGPQFQWIQAIGLDGLNGFYDTSADLNQNYAVPWLLMEVSKPGYEDTRNRRIGPQPGHESRPLSLRARAIDGRLGRSALRDIRGPVVRFRSRICMPPSAGRLAGKRDADNRTGRGRSVNCISFGPVTYPMSNRSPRMSRAVSSGQTLDLEILLVSFNPRSGWRAVMVKTSLVP